MKKRKKVIVHKKTAVEAAIIGRLPSTWTTKKVSALATLAATRGGFSGHAIVSFKLVADPEMRRLNRMYRNKDKTTDVLSFSYRSVTPAPTPVIPAKAGIQNKKTKNKKIVIEDLTPTELGDIVISLPQVTRQAKAIDRSVGDEFALMVVHGILHILGHDHETLAQETKMFALQHNILSEAKIW